MGDNVAADADTMGEQRLSLHPRWVMEMSQVFYSVKGL